MAPTNVERTHTLRLITVLTFIPCLGLSLGGAIACNGIIIGMGILPLFCSSLSGLVHMTHKGRTLALRRPDRSVFIDVVIGCMFLGVLIPFWIVERRRLAWMIKQVDFIIVETYASALLMVNAAIHFYIAFTQMYAAVSSAGFLACRECEECRRKAGRDTEQRTHDGAQYSPLLNPDEEPYRDSMDTVTGDATEDPQAKLSVEAVEEVRPSSARGEEEAMLAQV
ncbi:hypothetical protein BU16DRAFT_577760 [Lophium mytilinum]|uniref:Uncharacterized protein n=1 Tax=Lophium mytilinum TaxID=390894 RepID=A0A6A6RAD8_9PEZI|nr:hypothetical protein BU16DRAFT_577760 [Lophium mytilinum]